MIHFTASEIMDLEIGGTYQFINSLKNASPLHDHDYYEFFLITQGDTLHQVNGSSVYLPQGSLVFIRPADSHCYQPASEKTCQFINMTFSAATLEKLFLYLDQAFPFSPLLTGPLPPVSHLSAQENFRLKERLEELNTRLCLDTSIYKIKLRALLAELFTRYFFTQEITGQQKNLPMWLKQLCTALSQPDHFSYTMEQMERRTQKSREHICRSFSKYLHTTPARYLNQARLNYAANLLVHTDLRIIDLSLECGFQNLSHFYHLFKKQYGVAPAQFRQRQKNAL